MCKVMLDTVASDAASLKDELARLKDKLAGEDIAGTSKPRLVQTNYRKRATTIQPASEPRYRKV